MTHYRVEVTERTTLVRETWVEAATPAEARTQGEALVATGGRIWQQVYTDADVEVTLVEDVDSGEVVWDGVSGDPS